MNTGWIIVLVGLAAAVVAAASSWLSRRDEFDLGTVSHQWIAEQRFGAGGDPRR